MKTSSLGWKPSYALTPWQGLTVFLTDGRVELDTNPVERAMRPIALNRKNALLAGSDEGAHHWAVLATLVENCKLHGVNPTVYFTDILTRLVIAICRAALASSRPGPGRPSPLSHTRSQGF